MKTGALAALTSLVAASIWAAKPCSTFRGHAEANVSDGPVFSQQLQLFGKRVTIEKVPTLSEMDVTGLHVYPASDGSYGALFYLNPHGRLALDSLSVERRGRFLFVFINGRAIPELQIDRHVSDGKIYIASGLTSNDIERLKKDWPPSARK
jgi:hypothetical protein